MNTRGLLQHALVTESASLRIKVCGITRVDDARRLVDLGADAMGLNFVPGSPRSIDLTRAMKILTAVEGRITTIGVLMDASLDELLALTKELPLDALQLHGQEPPELFEALPLPGIKTVAIRELSSLREADAHPAAELLLDTASISGGGSGERFDWSLLAAHRPRKPFWLAGGLTPENVALAVKQTAPRGVDVASGVEQAPGIKDPSKLTRFIQAARAAQTSLASSQLSRTSAHSV